MTSLGMPSPSMSEIATRSYTTSAFGLALVATLSRTAGAARSQRSQSYSSSSSAGGGGKEKRWVFTAAAAARSAPSSG